jgi:acetyltransferase-like isoleucine patch superfamily enzyme
MQARNRLGHAVRAVLWAANIRQRLRPLRSQPELEAVLKAKWQTEFLDRPGGCSLPSLEGALISRAGPSGSGNWLVFLGGKPAYFPTRTTLDKSCANNIAVFGGLQHFPTEIHFQGSGCILVWGPHIPWPANVSVRFSSNDQRLVWGAGSTSNGTRIVLEGDGRRVLVGDDCMFAAGTSVNTSDLHAIVDLTRESWLNPPADVEIAEHVWVGQDALILKGTKIGRGSIVGAKALVNRSVPAFSIAAGVPARTIKSDVSWDRARRPTSDAIQQLLAKARAPLTVTEKPNPFVIPDSKPINSTTRDNRASRARWN